MTPTATIKTSVSRHLWERRSGRLVHPALSSLLAERAEMLGQNATYLLFKTRKSALECSRRMQSAGYAVQLESWPIPMVIKFNQTWILELIDAWDQRWIDAALAVVSDKDVAQ